MFSVSQQNNQLINIFQRMPKNTYDHTNYGPRFKAYVLFILTEKNRHPHGFYHFVINCFSLKHAACRIDDPSVVELHKRFY